jgi:hypothetical protein
MTEEAIMDELKRLAIEWALEEEPVGTTMTFTYWQTGASLVVYVQTNSPLL